MRKVAFVGLFLAAASPVSGQAGTAAAGGGELVDRVVAVVGDTVLLLSDIQTELRRVESAGQLPAEGPAREQFAVGILESKVSDLMLVVAARRDGITVPEEQLTEQVDAQFRQLEQSFGSPAALDAAFVAEGITRDMYRQTLREQARDRQLVQAYLQGRLGNRARPVIDEEDIAAYFEARRGLAGERPATVSFQQVVVSAEPSAEARAAAVAEAEQVLRELSEGGDFEVLARRFSDDPGSAEHGGDLGWFRTGRMVPEFERAAFSLRPGQTSGLVESDFGFHIIRLDRSRGAERQARHILITPEVSEADIARARVRADSIATAVRGGANVLELAQSYNTDQDPPSADRYPVDRLMPQYVAPLNAAAVGDVVGPIELEDPNGTRFAIVKVSAKAPAGAFTLDDVRDQLRETLQEEAMMASLLEELREEVYVSVTM
mgnify:CR=1 FL=1